MKILGSVINTLQRCVRYSKITEGKDVRTTIKDMGITPTFTTVGIIKRMEIEQRDGLYQMLELVVAEVGTINKVILPPILDILGNANNLEPMDFIEYCTTERIAEITNVLFRNKTRTLDLSSIKNFFGRYKRSNTPPTGVSNSSISVSLSVL
ncbi:hypothetical protein ACFL52_00310 [Candidatus Margulisiibacteriota bacterium]